MKICILLGTRPGIVKMSPVIKMIEIMNGEIRLEIVRQERGLLKY
jgi:UDP-N-acetylglucosamine 2-epimerase